MIPSLLTFVLAAAVPQPITPVPVPIFQLAASTLTLNIVANPGFETSPVSAAWSNPGSWGDPTGEGDPDDFDPILNGRSTGMHRSGAASFSFDLDSQYNGGFQGFHSAVAQSVSPTSTGSVISASLYASSTGGKWDPSSLEVEIDYTDAAPSYYDQDVSDSYYDSYKPGGGWRLVDFKSSLRAGKTISKITVSTTHYGYDAPSLWIDDVSVVKKVPIYLPPYKP